ncbi:MAG: hypothetical protein M0Z66_13460 [Thermaerobacter sp.]|nr:hypothetical protein [Thermaerobacter sp.]
MSLTWARPAASEDLPGPYASLDALPVLQLEANSASLRRQGFWGIASGMLRFLGRHLVEPMLS